MSKVFQSYCCVTGKWGAQWVGLDAADEADLPDSIGLIELSSGADLSACYMDVSALPHHLVHRPVSEVAAAYLKQYKSDRKRAIDRQAGAARSKVASQGYGQEMTYFAKENEARACLDDVSPMADNYPLLAAEIGITGPDLMAVATAVLAKATEWRAIAAAIEAARLGAKKQIDTATTETEVEQIIGSVAWPSVS